ncbi:MAG TPA: glutathione peroxidase [Myxococcales bacterium]|nr:glutathione peroxidase [Myxococcales bacterium]HAN32387.1 glutathione peroxidase [Myxococcales bacterium]|tara:strand:- start:476 stop:1087 length:612 start_codon:yes stop_codon:yes gene_type:complete
MKTSVTGLALACLLCISCGKSAHDPASRNSTSASAASKSPARGACIKSLKVNDIEGKSVKLSAYKGKVLLIVNTASQCGFTRQYADLQELQDAYEAKGFSVLGFPSNDFGGQEPGSSEQIRDFVDKRFKVSFPMFAKVSAKGASKSALYKTLTERSPQATQGEVRWNFTKFLIDKEGFVIDRFSPMTSPTSDAVTEAIERALK